MDARAAVAPRAARYTHGRSPNAGVNMLRTLLLVSLVAFSLAACGNKGALVLPDKQDQQDKDKAAAKKAAEPAAQQQ